MISKPNKSEAKPGKIRSRAANANAASEIIYASIVKIEDEIKDKKSLQKILLCDVQNKIYPKLEKSFLSMLSNSGYPDIKFNKKIDFEKLYKEKFN